MKYRILMTASVLPILFLVAASPFPSSASQSDESDRWSGVIYGGTGFQKKAPKGLEASAKKRVAERHGLNADELEITNSSVAHYRHSNREAYLFDLEDRAGNEYYVWLDKAGREVDEKLLLKEDNDARFSKYGKLSETLNDYIAKASSDEEIPVFVLVEMPPDTDKPKEKQTSMSSERLKNMSDEEKRQIEKDEEEFEKQLHDYNLRRVQMFVEPIAERLRKIGSGVQVSGTSAQIYAKLTSAMIKQVGTWKEVRAIDRVGTARPELDVSRQTIGASLVENRGINGTGEQVALVEIGGRILNQFGASNPYLLGATQDATTSCNVANDHSAGVAGVIRCTNNLPPGARGMAPNVGLFAGGSCIGDTNQLRNMTTSAINWGARAINLSWGKAQDPQGFLGLEDQYYDARVFDDRRTIVKSAGNLGQGTGDITSPGNGYNIITVGAFDDHNTVDWNGDTMAPFSSFVDPFSNNGDRMKPEVVAPGVDITTTTSSNVPAFQRADGTSFAAPHVTGEAALIMHRADSLGSPNTKKKPEVIKAIIIASADHEIDFQDRLRDGMGAISASWADDMVTGFFGGFGWETLGCFDPNLTILIPLQVGHLTRVAITWSTNPSYGNYFDQPSSDLTLRLYDPLGNLATPYGNGFDNTFETVDFATTIGGTYTLRIKKPR